MTVLNPKNIYYMLSYAYRILTEGAFKEVGGEEFENIHNLFAEILYLGVSHQIKRGLTREYEEIKEEIGTVRGKISIKDSFHGIAGYSSKLVCSFDEYTANTTLNRILKTTLNLLIHADDVDISKKNKLKSLMKYFVGVDLIDPLSINWRLLQYHRNNATYKMLMNLCYLVISGMIIAVDKNTYRLSEFIDNQEMHQLYEHFIFEYFRRHHPEFHTSRKKVAWAVDECFENRNSPMIDLLPDMQTDITLRHGEKVLIIDAKFYSNILVTSHNSTSKKIRSSHLYQIFSYVKNLEAEELEKGNQSNVEGMLLYALTDEDSQFSDKMTVSIMGNQVHVATLNLAGDWSEVVSKLEKIADDFAKNHQ